MKSMMKKVSLFLAGMSLVFASATNANTMVNEFENGKVDLVSGESLEGFVAPLGQFSTSHVLFKTTENDAPINLRFQNIKSIQKQGVQYLPKTIRVQGRPTSAYLEEKVDGYFKLYRAHFYAPMKRGKNNSTTELQSAWVIYSPIKGYVVLGKQVRASELNEALIHPRNTNSLSPQIVDDNQLVELVRDLNKSI